MSMKTIVIQAAPSVRTMCPVSYVEGEWRDIPACAQEIEFGFASPDHECSDPNAVLEEVTLLARPSGRMMRRASDGVTAPVWEVRRPADWPPKEKFNFFRS